MSFRPGYFLGNGCFRTRMVVIIFRRTVVLGNKKGSFLDGTNIIKQEWLFWGTIVSEQQWGFGMIVSEQEQKEQEAENGTELVFR